MDQGGLARHQLGVEGGVIIGQQVLLGRDQQVLGLGQLVRVGAVDRVAERFQTRRHQPAVGRQHRDLALEIVRRLQQVVPAGRLLLHQVAAIAQARGAPGIRHRMLVARIVGQIHGLLVQVRHVGNLAVIELSDQPEMIQRLDERARREHHVIALAAAGGHLAHHVFVVDLDRPFGLDAGLLREVGQQILRPIGVPLRNDDLLLGQRSTADAQHQRRHQRGLRHQSCHEKSPAPFAWPLAVRRPFDWRNCIFVLENTSSAKNV